MLEFLQDVPRDQIIALGCQGFSLLAAIAFYHVLDTRKSSMETRHAISSLIGVCLLVVCYGTTRWDYISTSIVLASFGSWYIFVFVVGCHWECLHLFALCFISYTMIVYLPANQRGWMTFCLCVGYVLSVHLHIYLEQRAVFRVDVTGSLMVLAIKSSYTAFSVDDNHKPKSELTSKQLKHRLKEVPSFFEYFSFCFCFLGALFGPAYHFSDYMRFIRGEQYKSQWPAARASRMLAISVVCLLSHFLLVDTYSAGYNLSPATMNASFLARHFILWFTMLVARCKYYFVWLSSEAICYFCGLGYEDSSDGREWKSSVSTVKLGGVELATNLKMFADSWNIFTTQWLHFCVYERVEKYKVFWVFLLSATWHGFYPGYYLMFAPLALAVLLGKKMRRTIRPLFQKALTRQKTYDIVTWLGTAIIIAFNSSAFELKTWLHIYTLQSSLYFWPHIIVILGLIIIPSKISPEGKSAKCYAAVANGRREEYFSHSG